MIILRSTDILRLVVVGAANITVDTFYVDRTTATGVWEPDRATAVAAITASGTYTTCGSPAAGDKRNIRGQYITNNHATASATATVQTYNGTTANDLFGVTLLPGENLILDAEGNFRHKDKNGAEYPASGLGAYTGRSITFWKAGTAADAVGYWYSSSKDAGFPGAWAPGTPGVNGRVTDGTASADFGCVPIPNPATGANYLTGATLTAGIAGTTIFYDCLWVNSGLTITTTTAQSITTPTLPARDLNGATAGQGCEIAILCTAAVGLAAVASNATVSYTNSDGTAGRTATLSAIVGSQAPATPVIGTVVIFNLAAGDRGVQSIQSITLNTSWVSGSISLMIIRRIATIGTVAGAPVTYNPGSPGTRLYNGICLLHMVLAGSTSTPTWSGELAVMEK